MRIDWNLFCRLAKFSSLLIHWTVHRKLLPSIQALWQVLAGIWVCVLVLLQTRYGSHPDSLTCRLENTNAWYSPPEKIWLVSGLRPSGAQVFLAIFFKFHLLAQLQSAHCPKKTLWNNISVYQRSEGFRPNPIYQRSESLWDPSITTNNPIRSTHVKTPGLA